MSKELQIDEEFQNLLPQLSEDEFAGLEKQILEDGGVTTPIDVWNGVIVDGHNRYAICQKHKLVCPTRERKFDSRDAAKIWIYDNQNSRRNLEPGQKAALAIERSEAEERERARIRQAAGRPKKTSDHVITSFSEEKSDQGGRVIDFLAKKAGVGSATVQRTLRVKRESPELYEQIKTGEIPVHTAYKQVNNKKALKEDYADPEKSLRENVAVFNRDSLIAELKGSAKMLDESWHQSLEINETQNVKLTKAEKNILFNAIEHLYDALKRIKKEG